MLNEMHSLSLLRLKYLKKMHVKSCSLTLLNHTSPGQVPLRSSLLQGSRFWAGCVGEAERARECTYSLRWSLSFSFFLPSHSPRVSNDSLRKQLLALGNNGKCPQLARPGEVLCWVWRGRKALRAASTGR